MSAHYNATVTKIRAIYGKRISDKDYQELINLSNVSEITDYLKRNTHYCDILSTVDTNTLHRGMLENLLRKKEFETYLKITKFEGLAKNEFYNYIFLRSEVDEVLNCIRMINAKSEKQIETMQIYYNPYTPIDFLELAKMRTFPDLLVLLKKTPYYNVLSGIVPNEKGKVDYLKCETKMRTYYLHRLLESVGGKKDDSETLKFLIMSDIDLINVINSYRQTAFFGESEDVIVEDMLPFSGRLSPAKLEEIYSAPTADEFLNRFAKTYYGRQMIDKGLDVKDLEYSVQKLRYKYTKAALTKSESAPLSVYAFMYLRHIEVVNLITIIEAIRYKIPTAQIQSLLII